MKIIDNERRINEVRAARLADPNVQARKEAAVLYAALQPHARHFHNSGNLFEAAAASSILRAEPITFHAFWGVGGKRIPDNHDEKLLSELALIGKTVAEKYHPGAQLQLMLADTHGGFNGFARPVIYEYLVRIQDNAAKRGIGAIWLSDLYSQWNLELPNPREAIDPNSEFYSTFWLYPGYSRQLEQLIKSAAKHHGSGVDPEIAAYQYARMRRAEAPYLAAYVSSGVLLVNTSKDLGMILLPREVPHMYLKTPAAWFLGVNLK